MNENAKLKAFKMHENLYFIGSEAVSVHLLDTEDGLVLIDSGYPSMYELIVSNIRALGFFPENICAIFHSHGHVDHFGTTRELVALSGAKTYISRIDNEIVNGTLDLSWAKELNVERIAPFDCDVLVEDGDTFRFGSTEIRCVLTPGHTAGVLSFVITLPDGTVAAMHGGIGTNTLRSAFLLEYGLPFDCRDDLKASCRKLMSERVALVLGNHPQQTETVEKMIRLENGESVLDGEEWERFLNTVIEMVDGVEKSDPRPS